MIATGSTLIEDSKVLKDLGVRTLTFACSLPLLNGPAIDRLSEAYEKGLINGVIGTDAVYHGGEDFVKAHPWYHQVSVAGYFAEVIKRLHEDRSISGLLDEL